MWHIAFDFQCKPFTGRRQESGGIQSAQRLCGVPSWGRSGFKPTKPHLLLYAQSDTSNSLYPLDLEGGLSTSRCMYSAITDTLSYRDDLQPLLPGASSANVHLPLTEGSQSRDEAMEFVTSSLFGLVCHLNSLRVVALDPQSQNFARSRLFFLVFLLRALHLYLASPHRSSKYI